MVIVFFGYSYQKPQPVFVPNLTYFVNFTNDKIPLFAKPNNYQAKKNQNSWSPKGLFAFTVPDKLQNPKYVKWKKWFVPIKDLNIVEPNFFSGIINPSSKVAWTIYGKNKDLLRYNNVQELSGLSKNNFRFLRSPSKYLSGYWIWIDLQEQVLVLFDDRKMVFATLVSTGLSDTPTPKGEYKIFKQKKIHTMTGGKKDDFYYLQDVPWVMYFKPRYAIHGTYWHDSFGNKTSHGCINLSLSDSKWVYEWSRGKKVKVLIE